MLSHNDLNPSNLIYDGEALLILDWSTAGPSDAFVDLATLAVFLRMDDLTCLGLLAAYDDASPRHSLPDSFVYTRRLMAAVVLCITGRLAQARLSFGGMPSATSEFGISP